MTVTIIDLSANGTGYDVPKTIDNNDHVLISINGFPNTGPFLWTDGTITTLATLPNFPANDGVEAESENGSAFLIYAPVSNIPSTDGATEVYVGGQIYVLTPLPGEGTYAGVNGPIPSYQFAYSVNDKGVAVGPAENSSNLMMPVMWDKGVVSVLPLLPGFQTGTAYVINDQGVVAGTDNVVNFSPNGQNSLGWIYQNGTLTALQPLSGDISSGATSMNEAGIVAGTSTDNHALRAVTWDHGVVTALATVAGEQSAYAARINDVGQIIGEYVDSTGTQVAALWQDGKLVDLNTLLAAGSGWSVTSAYDINDNGEVMVQGTINGKSGIGEIQLTFTAADAANPAYDAYFTHVRIADSAADIQANLDAIEALAAQGKVASIAFTDTGIPTLSLTTSQLASYKDALADIFSNFTLSVTAPSGSVTIAGESGHANTLDFSGASGQYTITPSGDGAGFTISGNGATDQVSGVQALKFADTTDIVASQTPSVAGAVSGAQITELYGAVLGRTPDLAGLSFYQSYAAANPATPFLQYAEWFLSSPEYTDNSAHKYAHSADGDAQFITDSYANLLHRTPDSGAIPYYQKVVAGFTDGLTPGTTAYQAAQLQGHAQVLVYFSQSPEFLADVSVTAQNPSSASHWLVLI